MTTTIISACLLETESTGASGFLRNCTGANGRKRFSTNTYRNIVLFLQKSSKNLRKPPGVHGRMYSLGILYSSSLSDISSERPVIERHGGEAAVGGGQNWVALPVFAIFLRQIHIAHNVCNWLFGIHVLNYYALCAHTLKAAYVHSWVALLV